MTPIIPHADCDQGLGDADDSLDDYPEARRRYTAARAVYVRLGLDRQGADCDHNLGHLADSLVRPVRPAPVGLTCGTLRVAWPGPLAAAGGGCPTS
jgi:hypothetical protein